ncbi:helix-turn-helix domain-containing protein [Clostridium sp. Ade.TY]|uniref:MerR family transcriptional regulator n=1 Tax=Clostridium sp. Ade.TY TaxID=1391647 RepID=UPI0003FA9202|nr:helix-turn-helix domain-containing protein [Clostridium sp. Ade.TY]
MEKLFSIGEVSKIKDITIKALRYYHKIGILIPKYIDKDSGYRYYSIDQFIHIDIIKGCRTLGTSIKELQEIFENCNTDELILFLNKKKLEAEENIKKKEEVIDNINRLDSVVSYSKQLLNNTDIKVKYFKKRYVVITPCKEAGSLKELIYYSDLDKIIKNKRLKVSMERGIIYSLNSKDGVLENENLKSKYVFNTIDDDLEFFNNEIFKDDNIKVLEEGKYLTLAYSKDNEKECLIKLNNYIKENNIKMKSYIEIDLFNDFFDTDYYSCQIQILIDE